MTIVSTSYYMFSVMYTFLMQYTCKCARVRTVSVVVLCILTLMCNI